MRGRVGDVALDEADPPMIDGRLRGCLGNCDPDCTERAGIAVTGSLESSVRAAEVEQREPAHLDPAAITSDWVAKAQTWSIQLELVEVQGPTQDHGGIEIQLLAKTESNWNATCSALESDA